MIEIHPLRDGDRLAKLYNEKGIKFTDDSIAVVAHSNDEILGCCLFDLTLEKGTVHHIEPADDIMFADGILRSALHVCVENGVFSVFYSESAPIKLIEKLGFIKNDEGKQLNVDKLF